MEVGPQTDIDDTEKHTGPAEYKLDQNYPNPFNPSTRIEFVIPETDFVQIKLYDSSGRMIKFLVNKKMSAGKHTAYFNASDLASGIYFYQINAGDFSETKKMVFIK